MLKVQILQGILMKDLGLSWATKLSFLLKSLIPVQLLCILTRIQGLIPQRQSKPIKNTAKCQNFLGIQLILLKFQRKVQVGHFVTTGHKAWGMSV